MLNNDEINWIIIKITQNHNPTSKPLKVDLEYEAKMKTVWKK